MSRRWKFWLLNDPQITGIAVCSAPMVAACFLGEHPIGWIGAVCSLGFWVGLAFLANLISGPPPS